MFVWGNGIALDISPDELRVSIEISPAYASYYSPEKLERFLAENNIVCETDHETIDRIFEEYLFNQSLVVAEGVLPQNGEDGRIEWEIDLSILDGAELVEQGGRVDWKEHNYILPVIEEQHLARMIDPTEGTPGVNVHGEAIPANLGKEIKFPAGKGVKISDDGHELISEISGVVCREGTKISVTPVFTVPGDVDFSTGNINYDGTVVVNGSVLVDFNIRAGQDIHVKGLVEGANLTARGNIYITNGIQGTQKAYLRAGGNIEVKFINQATLEAEGDIIVGRSIIQSFVKAKGRVMVEGQQAVITGGTTSAEYEISASVIGSKIGVHTHLIIGEDVSKLVKSAKKIRKKIKILQKSFLQLKKPIKIMKDLMENGQLDPKQEKALLKLVRTRSKIKEKIKHLKMERKNLIEQLQPILKKQKGVAVKKTAWPGTVFEMMNRTHHLKTPAGPSTITFVNKEIMVFESDASSS